ncbi:acyl-CoA dehydratase activase [Chloroflexota bacterium]
MYSAGIDIGSTMTKVVIIDQDGAICSRVIGPTGAEHRHQANMVMEKALEQSGLSFDAIDYVIATGYGRFNVPFADHQVTELSCHARGIASFFPSVKTAIDIGGQDAKGLKINNGKLVDFVMNDKCAAGTGRFLEVTADTLGLRVEDLGSISLKSTNQVEISNICTFFAQQEVISRLSEGTPIADILAGLHNSIASRVINMVRRLKIEPDVVLTGGVAMNVGMVQAVKENLKCEVFVPDDPLLSGAVGAAILAREFVLRILAKGEPITRKERKLEETTFFR